MRKLTLALLAALPMMAQAAQIDDWRYSQEIDPITDEDTSVAITLSDDGGALMVMCLRGEPRVIINAGVYLGHDQQLSALWRIDGNEPKPAEVPVVDEMAVLPAHVMDDMIEGAQAIIRIADFRGTRHTHTFSLRGFYDATGLLSCVE